MSEEDLAALRAELATTRTTLEETEDTLATTQATLATTRTTLSSAQADLATARTNLADAEDERDAAQATLATRTQELAAANQTLTTLRQTLTTTQADLTAAEDDLEEAQEALRMARNTLETRERELREAQDDLDTAQNRLSTTQQQVLQETQARQEAEQEAQNLQEEARDLNANQRAQNLRAAFPPTTPLTAMDSPVGMTVARGSLRLTRSRHSNASLSGSGIRSATMNLTSGSDPGKTVVYTDRELRRPLLEHFGTARNEDDMTLFDVGADPLELPAAIPHITTPQVTTRWRVPPPSGLSSSVAGVDEDDNDGTPLTLPTGAVGDNTVMANSIAGYLYGLRGDFVCRGADGCQVTVAPTYPTLSGTRFPLATIAITPTTGTLHFKPSGNPSIDLYEGGPVGADGEYMVFGYWREDPVSPAGVYQFGVFADVVAPDDATDGTFDGSVSYDGIAVGSYVEQDPNNPVDTHRQGDFTADVSLTATTLTDVYGTVDDFVVTPTGGSAAPRTSDRWVLTLINATGQPVHLNLAGGGTRGDPANGTGTATTTDGNWTREFVPLHPNAATAPPPAVTGVFNARIVDFLHLVGAYGAER